MSRPPSCALAVDHTLAVSVFTFEYASNLYTATVAAGVYRHSMAPSASDLVRVTAAAMTAAPGLPGGVTFTGTYSTSGFAQITSSADTWLSDDIDACMAGASLGFIAGGAGSLLVTQTASLRPRYIAFFGSAKAASLWNPRQDGAREVTAGGVVYSFGGSNTSYMREVLFELIPWSPQRAAEADSTATPFEPDDQYLASVGSTSTARTWSLLDVLYWARNANAALSLDWQALRASTQARYFIGRVATLFNPEAIVMDETWPMFVSHKLGFVLPTTGNTGTRA